MSEVLPLNQRTTADGMDHAAWPQIGHQVESANRFSLRVVVQGRVGVAADMR